MSDPKMSKKMLKGTEEPITGEIRTEILSEYTALRGEILSRIGTRNQIITFTIVILGALITFSMQKEVTAVIILLYPFLNMFLALGWAHNDYRVGQISHYIGIYIEPRLEGLGWETYIDDLRPAKGIKRFLRPTGLSAAGVIVGTEILALVLAMPKLTWSRQERYLLACDIIAILLTIYVLQRRAIRHGKGTR